MSDGFWQHWFPLSPDTICGIQVNTGNCRCRLPSQTCMSWINAKTHRRTRFCADKWLGGWLQQQQHHKRRCQLLRTRPTKSTDAEKGQRPFVSLITTAHTNTRINTHTYTHIHTEWYTYIHFGALYSAPSRDYNLAALPSQRRLK